MENKDHASAYKSRGLRGVDQARRRRQDNALQLRKEKREENLAKRRNLAVNDSFEDGNTQSPSTAVLSEKVDNSGQNTTATKPLAPLHEIVEGIHSGIKLLSQNCATLDHLTKLLHYVQQCRKMLSRERKPPIDSIIDSGLVPSLVQLLQLDKSGAADDPTRSGIMFESAWALTNICSGTAKQTKSVADAGAIPQFVRLLRDVEHLNVVEQAAWALGNIAGDGPHLRDQVLHAGCIEPLIKLLSLPSATVPFLQNTTWTLSNLCRNKNPPTSLEHVEQMLPTLVKLLGHSDRQVKTDSCWAMSYLTDGANDRIECVLRHNALPSLVKLLMVNKDISVLTPVLRSVGNIVTGTDEQTQAVINANALKCFPNLLKHEKTSIQKEAAWTLSNITAGTAPQIQAFIDAGLIEPIMNCLLNGDFKTQKEAVWCVTNFTSGGISDQVRLLCQAGAINGLCNMLNCKEDRTLAVILDGIQNILIHAEKLGCLEQAVDNVEENGGVEKIEKLQHSLNTNIYQLAYRLIDTYFGEEEDDAENIDGVVKAVDKDGQFAFSENKEEGGQNPQGTFQF